jgi:peptidoglycan/LPS O-acetylase OafA/YrhL
MIDPSGRRYNILKDGCMSNKKETLNSVGKGRDSNFELLRIILMLLIVLHHYCVNSGFPQIMNLSTITSNTILIEFMSIWGKVGVNGFLILSGYFMVNSYFKIEKVYKLISEVLFYNIVVTVFLLLIGYNIGMIGIIKCIVPIIFYLPETFIGSYLLVYILSPVINTCMHNISKEQLQFVLCILLVYFSIVSTFLLRDTWNYFGWAITMYLVGGYIKLYNNKFFDCKLIWFIISVFCTILIWASELVVDFVGVKFGFKDWMYMMSNANKFPVFIMALSIFLFFKNIKITSNKIINTIAASSFGVLLIHANSDMMRQWLWKDLLKNTAYFDSKYLWIHMIISVASIYCICTIIDIFRIKFIENQIFHYAQRNKKI